MFFFKTCKLPANIKLLKSDKLIKIMLLIEILDGLIFFKYKILKC
jgi:hypothetical protein